MCIIIITTNALAVHYWEGRGGAVRGRAGEIDSGISPVTSHLGHLEHDATTVLILAGPAFRLRFLLR